MAAYPPDLYRLVDLVAIEDINIVGFMRVRDTIVHRFDVERVQRQHVA